MRITNYLVVIIYFFHSNIFSQVHRLEFQKLWKVTSSDSSQIKMIDITFRNNVVSLLGKNRFYKAVLLQYDAEGKYLKEISFSDSLIKGIQEPTAFDSDTKGRYYIIDNKKTIKIFNNDGKYLTHYYDTKKFLDIVSYDWNMDTTVILYFLYKDYDNYGIGKLYITYNKEGVPRIHKNTLSTHTFKDSRPYFIIINQSNNDYIYAVSNDLIKVDATTLIQEYHKDFRHCENKREPIFSDAIINGEGSHPSIYLVDTLSNKLYLYSSNASCMEEYGESGIEAGKFNKPISITIDYVNNIYVADTGNNRIQKIKIK